MEFAHVEAPCGDDKKLLDAKIVRQFERFLVDTGYRLTKQRRTVILAALAAGSHFDAEKILMEAKKIDDTIGFATIYRNLQLMIKAGMLVERGFSAERRNFEMIVGLETHHDHLICEECGAIIEFCDMEIEKLQEEIARKMGFKLSGHKMILRGHCLSSENCTKKICKEKE